MAIELEKNQGVLFQNDKTNEKQPDFTGGLRVGDRQVQISGWNGEKGVSVVLSEKAGEKYAEVGKGFLYPNDKGDNPKRPDYRGKVLLSDGPEVPLSVWKHEREGKKTMLSIEVGEVGKQKEATAERQRTRGGIGD
ncbi:MAG: hypothetical protein C75L2_00020039 [Leptospirillum sp. Group II 'C75']|jgi:uncharacterized protein (DUF736 family)|uniref:hypothetical protein n=1 Tax=Leptospirillum sp. Group II 'CF-1' TaxID=1660083 RepID=UPI00029CBBD7|nr:hypothetical protein [Leptospirillum sp. Group II 'CF-1']AKS22866.1 hypothetical protein ABH19_02530 [Leptospirillum sp. Group II 'CF-1']EIJ75141.1 MAG: hypothetical protein C75L2_00020039 [Leptospirillum sp. Group II 'C75']